MLDKSLIYQGKGMLRRLLFCVSLFVVALHTMAQGNIPTSNNEESKFKADNFGFNAIDLRQGRFLHSDSVEYKQKKFYDHLSAGVVWHYDKIHERIAQGYGAALNYGVFVEKELNKLHALRLLFYQGTYQQNQRSIRMNKYQMELLYSFNWTRFFGGYNPYRKMEAVTSFGVGGFYSERVDKVEIGPMFIMSAGARMQLSPLFILGIEPYVALAGDGIDHSGSLNYRKYDVLYGTDVSLSYTFHDELSKEQRRGYRGNTFVDFGLGVQLEPYTGFHLQPNMLPIFATAGPHLKLGLGHWLSPGFAVRVTGNLSTSNWDNTHIEANLHTNHPAYDIRLRNMLANGRLDLLFSPYHFFTGREDNRFDINAVVGWEYGWMIKTSYDPSQPLRTNYDGFSGGLQLRYSYDKYTALYLEPRLTLANYTIPYAGHYQDYVDRYRDYLFSLSAGLEFAMNEHCFLGKKKQPSKFNPHLSLSLQGGPQYMFTIKEYAGEPYIDYVAGIAGEMQVSPYSGVRVMADYSMLSNRDIYRYTQQMTVGDNILLRDTALVTGKYGFVNLSADYVFDLGTLLQGYNASNRWDVALALGPVYSHRVKTKAIISNDEMLWQFKGETPIATEPQVDHSRVVDHALGLQLGIPVSYRISPQLDVLFEPRARIFSSDYIDQVHSQGLAKILQAQVGLRYTLNDRYYVPVDSLIEHFELKRGHLFTHMAVGGQTPKTLADMGPRLEAGVGYGFNPGVGARASFNITSHDWRRHQDELFSSEGSEATIVETSLRQLTSSGRMDLLLDPYGYLVNRYDRPLGFNFVAGWEYGLMLRGNMSDILTEKYNALSTGFQLRYNYDTYRTLYVEPRYTYNLATKNGQYSVVAGMELGTTESGFRSKRNQPGEFAPSLSFAMLGGAGYVYNGKEYTSAPVSDYTGGITAEYRYGPYSGIRLTLGYTSYRLRGLYYYHQKDFGTTSLLHNYNVDYMNIGVDYLFDVTTLLQGYTKDRKWNAAFAIGPTLGSQVAYSELATKSGCTPSHGEMARRNLWGIQLGAPVSYRIDGNWEIMFEPRGKVAMKHPFDSQTRYPFAQYDALVGVKYTPGERFYKRIGELNQNRDYRHDFVNYAMGVQYAAGTGIPFAATGGVQLGLGAGRWMNSLWGVRFGAEMGTSHLYLVNTSEGGIDCERLLKSARAGARSDVMVNPFAFSRDYQPKRWGTALLLGWELGGKIDAKYTHLNVHAYNSLSVGAQLRCHTDEKHALYIEPRYMLDDRLVSVTAGLEFAMTEHRFRSSKNQPAEFKPYYNVGFAGGVNHLFLPCIYAGAAQLDFDLGLSGEYHFTPYSGTRLSLGYSHLVNAWPRGVELVNYGIGHLNMGVDYMLDLSTLFAGYTPTRRWNVSLATGPVFSTRVAANKDYAHNLKKAAIGMQLGIPVQFRVTKHFGISLEPRARVFGPDYATPRYTIGGFTSKIINVQLGMKYTF